MGGLWKKYELVNVAEAVAAAAAAADMLMLEQILKSKVESPLSAVVAALVLLRARRWERLHNWLRNAANWDPYFPDGPILWVEQLLRQSNSDLLHSEADDSFMRNVDGYWDTNRLPGM
jgi:hypothetical protein